MVDEGSKKLLDSVVKEDDILELNVTSTSKMVELGCRELKRGRCGTNRGATTYE